jgi:NTP pyrophosphatase (non-canonical NTP hydrolase)
MSDDFKPMTLKEYATEAATTDQRSDGASLSFPLLGLFGETGSLLSEVKKKQRDRTSYLGYSSAVLEEIGDVLWYLTAVAARGDIRLSAVAATILDDPGDWRRDRPDLTFEQLQPGIINHAAELNPAFETTLLQLAHEVGSLIADHNTGLVPADQDLLAKHLVAIMRRLLQAANEARLTLEAAAIRNLTKIFDRWPKAREYPSPFDEKAEADEKLPRRLEIEIYEREVRGQKYVFQRCNGIFIGDRLTDNATVADNYRFHDVFHFAHMAVLGWSPVIRALMHLKRKSDPKVDEAQDGARAILIEEGVTTWIFGQAKDLSFFKGLKVGGLPLDMLKQVRQFVAGYEGGERPLWLWEEAILQGYEAFRFLCQHRRGRLIVDMENHSLRIEALPQ